MLMSGFWKAPKEGGQRSREPTTSLEGWNFQSLPLDLWGKEQGWRLDQSSMANQLINLKVFQVGEPEGFSMPLFLASDPPGP